MRDISSEEMFLRLKDNYEKNIKSLAVFHFLKTLYAFA